MVCGSVLKALIARIIFGIHGFLTIWQAVDLMGDWRFWWLALALVALLVETLISIFGRGGKERKWFCPSVFFYLCSVVPATWFIELDLAYQRYNQHMFHKNNLSSNMTTPQPLISRYQRKLDSDLTLTKYLKQMPIALSYEMWAQVLEQFLLVNLILGRWLLPKGELTRDQLSQLLLVYIGMAADIVELFEAFKEPEVRYNLLLCKIILGIWSWSLLQFTLVITASKARKARYAWPVNWIEPDVPRFYCFTMDVGAIATTILLQDGPFFCLRIILIVRYGVVSYMNIFFTCKNALVLVLQLYRMAVVLCQNAQEYQRLKLLEERHRLSVQLLNSSARDSRSSGISTLPSQTSTIYDNYAFAPISANASALFDNMRDLKNMSFDDIGRDKVDKTKVGKGRKSVENSQDEFISIMVTSRVPKANPSTTSHSTRHDSL